MIGNPYSQRRRRTTGDATLKHFLAAGLAVALGAALLQSPAFAREGMGGRSSSPPVGSPRPPPVTRPNIPNRDAVRDAARAGGPPSSRPGIDLDAIEGIIERVGDDNAWRDSVWSRVFGNIATGNWPSSCVDASTSRARDIAAAIKADQGAGKLDLRGHTVVVGTRSGYQTFGASWHTYTVVEVKDPGGKTVEVFEVDTYVVPQADIDRLGDALVPSNQVDWSDPSHQADPVETVK